MTRMGLKGGYAAPPVRPLLACCVLLLAACPPPEVPVDAGVDASVPPTACASADGCRAEDAVCREGFCERDVPCGDDLECGLGERCVGGLCRFRGCVGDDECGTGRCDPRSYSCAECGADADCPRERPRCELPAGQCVRCTRDADCQAPGHAHCTSTGQCVACLTDVHCPNGLSCSSGNLCVGAPENAPCPEGVSCGPGLACVLLAGNNVCLRSCNLYEPQCSSGQICYSLSYSGTGSLVFEAMGPIGVCFAPQAGLRGPREPCVRTSAGTNCQPNLQCIPETATLSLCRSYCNPLASGTCPVGERCTPFVGDYNGREYGLCMADTGFGARCEGDRACRAGLSCQPWDIPSDDDEVGGLCQFDLGDGGALSPCAPQALPDGGAAPADRACRSGRCVRDPLGSSATPPYFCFAGCGTDVDCGDAGVCDAEFLLSTTSGTSGFMKGCRPRCEAEADCAGYDAGVTCRARLTTTASAPAYTTTCTPAPGALPAGAACTVNGQCRSGLCVLDDARGVRRGGVCATPCRDDSACALGLGEPLFPVACQGSALLLSRGFDGLAGTADDRLVAPRLCTGVACADDLDCVSDGGAATCGLDVADTLGALAQRCRAVAAGAKVGGESCAADVECRSGVCGTLQAPSTGSGRACFEACTGATGCPAGTSCRAGGLAVVTRGQVVSVDSCAP